MPTDPPHPSSAPSLPPSRLAASVRFRTLPGCPTSGRSPSTTRTGGRTPSPRSATTRRERSPPRPRARPLRLLRPPPTDRCAPFVTSRRPPDLGGVHPEAAHAAGHRAAHGRGEGDRRGDVHEGPLRPPTLSLLLFPHHRRRRPVFTAAVHSALGWRVLTAPRSSRRRRSTTTCA